MAYLKRTALYLLVDACRKRTVRYVNFIGDFTDAHGSWDYDFDSRELVIEFNHWGSLGSLRKCVIRDTGRVTLLPSLQSCRPMVARADTAFVIRLTGWTSLTPYS